MTDVRRDDIFADLGARMVELYRGAPDIDTGLGDLVDRAAQQVPGAQYAGITVAHPKEGIRTAAATHRYPVLLDEIQQRCQDGPCVSAAWEHQTMVIDDLAVDHRWPKYRRDALAQTPIRSVVSFELFVDHGAMSALNFYAESAGSFDAESREVGMIFATHVALGWMMLRREEQFRSALASRDVIGQAKGMIMERFNVDAVRAFELLQRLSQETNTKLVDLAQRLIETDRPTASP